MVPWWFMYYVVDEFVITLLDLANEIFKFLI